MLAKALLWWPAATTISGFIIAAVAVVAGTVSISLSILVLCLAAVLWRSAFKALWSAVDPTVSWTYFNKSSLSPAEQAVYVWPSDTGVAVWGTVSSWTGKRPIILCKSDDEVERAVAAGNSVATAWRPTLSKFVATMPLIPVFVEGDTEISWNDTWQAMQRQTPKCRITYGPPLRLTVRELAKAKVIWAEHMALAKVLCEEKRPAKKSASK